MATGLRANVNKRKNLIDAHRRVVDWAAYTKTTHCPLTIYEAISNVAYPHTAATARRPSTRLACTHNNSSSKAATTWNTFARFRLCCGVAKRHGDPTDRKEEKPRLPFIQNKYYGFSLTLSVMWWLAQVTSCKEKQVYFLFWRGNNRSKRYYKAESLRLREEKLYYYYLFHFFRCWPFDVCLFWRYAVQLFYGSRDHLRCEKRKICILWKIIIDAFFTSIDHRCWRGVTIRQRGLWWPLRSVYPPYWVCVCELTDNRKKRKKN